MGDDEISSFVKYGIGKAKKYSVTSKKDVCRYLNLMMILGVRFDEDEALPWAGEILNSSSLSSGETKMMYLNQTATQYLEEQENRDNKKQETVEQHWWFN